MQRTLYERNTQIHRLKTDVMKTTKFEQRTPTRSLLNTRADNKKTSHGVHARDNGQYNTLLYV